MPIAHSKSVNEIFISSLELLVSTILPRLISHFIISCGRAVQKRLNQSSGKAFRLNRNSVLILG